MLFIIFLNFFSIFIFIISKYNFQADVVCVRQDHVLHLAIHKTHTLDGRKNPL